MAPVAGCLGPVLSAAVPREHRSPLAGTAGSRVARELFHERLGLRCGSGTSGRRVASRRAGAAVRALRQRHAAGLLPPGPRERPAQPSPDLVPRLLAPSPRSPEQRSDPRLVPSRRNGGCPPPYDAASEVESCYDRSDDLIHCPRASCMHTQPTPGSLRFWKRGC